MTTDWTMWAWFIGGGLLGYAMGLVQAFDAARKKMLEDREVFYAEGYSNGLSDAKKPGSSIEWHQDHLPPSRL